MVLSCGLLVASYWLVLFRRAACTRNHNGEIDVDRN